MPTEAGSLPVYDLYFNVEFESVTHRVTRLSSANLKLFKKPVTLQQHTEQAEQRVTSSAGSISSRRRRVGVVTSEPPHVTSPVENLRVSIHTFNLNTNRRVARRGTV